MQHAVRDASPSLPEARSEVAPWVFLEEDTPGAAGVLYTNPRRVLMCEVGEAPEAALAAAQQAAAEGSWVVGYLGYPLAAMRHPKLPTPSPEPWPALWFGVFAGRHALSANAVASWLDGRVPARLAPLAPEVSRRAHRAGVRRILDYIREGDVYQINYTIALRSALHGDPLALYAALRRYQPTGLGGFVHTDRGDLLSRSPELFFEVSGNRVWTRPMKGTAPRYADPDRDRRAREALAADAKNRAENLMIVDLLRNDLGRLARPGSVAVRDLFQVETHPSLHQMTSTVQAELAEPLDLARLVTALFPCGSITGAPKLRAMQIIAALEPASRGPYTGAIGVLGPNETARFNVAIRTLQITPDQQVRLGVGGGIVADSESAAEYREALLKARFLRPATEDCRLLETLAWFAETGWSYLRAHYRRLAESAAELDYPLDPTAFRQALRSAAGRCRANAWPAGRVRVLVDAEGRVEWQAEPLELEDRSTRTVGLAAETLDPTDPWLRHKTDYRPLYDRVLRTHRARDGVDEVLFTNHRGELCEGTWTNVFIQRDGLLLTPPRRAGILPGILRDDLLRRGIAREATLVAADVYEADALWLGNAVRGLLPARPVIVDST